MRRTGNLITVCLILLLVNGFPVDSSHADESLAKQSQNPLGTIISYPFENNFYFGIGPSESTAYALTWKPVLSGRSRQVESHQQVYNSCGIQ